MSVTHIPVHRRALLVPLAAAIVVGAACVGAVAVSPVEGRTLMAWCLGTAAVLLCAAITFGLYGLQQASLLRDRLAAKDADLAAKDADLAAKEADLGQLAEHTLPALVQRLRDGSSVDTALSAVHRPASLAQQRILWTLAQEVGRGDRMRAAAMSACANAAGRVQALATSMLADLREMEDRHDEKVLGDLLRLDHSTAQAGRLADSIAVLTGARSGRRWTKPIVMESIMRGAVGRINAYQRVRVHSASSVAIAGHAAEGVMHALAELMDNAASFSPPSEEVHVYVEEVSTGIVVTIEDCGLVMSAAALNRARRAVSSEPLDLTTLSGTRLGLAVVGCLARKHGLIVSFRPSSRGGTGVVVMIPQQLLTQPPPAPQMDAPRPPSIPAAHRATSAHAAPAHAAPLPAPRRAPAEPVADGELPKRRRGQTLAAASTTPPAQPTPSTRPKPPVSEAGARFSAFRQASRGTGASGTHDAGTTGSGSPAGMHDASTEDDIR